MNLYIWVVLHTAPEYLRSLKNIRPKLAWKISVLLKRTLKMQTFDFRSILDCTSEEMRCALILTRMTKDSLISGSFSLWLTLQIHTVETGTPVNKCKSYKCLPYTLQCRSIDVTVNHYKSVFTFFHCAWSSN